MKTNVAKILVQVADEVFGDGFVTLDENYYGHNFGRTSAINFNADCSWTSFLVLVAETTKHLMNYWSNLDDDDGEEVYTGDTPEIDEFVDEIRTLHHITKKKLTIYW